MSDAREFRPVTSEKPCVICGNNSWCRRSAGGAHECHKITALHANGYDRISITACNYGVYRLPGFRRNKDSNNSDSQNDPEARTIKADLAAENDKYRAAISDQRKIYIANKLGVSVAALDSIEIGQADENDLRRLHASGAGWFDDYPSMVTTFPERDAAGVIIGFSFRADDGRKGSPSGKVGAKRGLIIPSTLASRSGPILILEGSSDVAACETLGLASVGRPSNTAGGHQLALLLKNKEILVVGENDKKPDESWPGREGAQTIAAYLANEWKLAVPWTLPPDDHKDTRAYLNHLIDKGLDLNDTVACHAAGQKLLNTLIAAAKDAQPRPAEADESSTGNSIREKLLLLCKDAGDHFFHDNKGNAYVFVKEGKFAGMYPLDSKKYERLLGWRFRQAYNTVLASTAKTEALEALMGIALFDGPEETVSIRLGEYGDKVVLDLCNDNGQVVVVDKDGWQVWDDSPIRFRRTSGMFALPTPVKGGKIDYLRPFINVGSDNDFILACAFILGCFNPRGPFMVLLVNGEPGSSKSTLCKVIRSLIDPSQSLLRAAPKTEHDLAISMNNAWMICFDNMSHIKVDISNALCRLATGGGFATRKLYSDSDEVIFDGKRPIMINGIGDVANRSDLIDRAIQLSLPTIPEDKRQMEKSFWANFHEKLPFILGALLDAVSCALRNQDDVKFTVLPRMADSIGWVVAAEPVCPWPPGAFMAAFDNQRHDADESICEASLVATAIRDWVQKNGEISGTVAELLDLLSDGKDDKILKHRDWPKGASAFGTKVREIAAILRRLGMEVLFDRVDRRRTITIRTNDK